jgi:hypothetical protein
VPVDEFDEEGSGLGVRGGDVEFKGGEFPVGVDGAPALEAYSVAVVDVHPRARGARVPTARRQPRRRHEQIVIELPPVRHLDRVHPVRHPIANMLRHPHKPKLRFRQILGCRRRDEHCENYALQKCKYGFPHPSLKLNANTCFHRSIHLINFPKIPDIVSRVSRSDLTNLLDH